MASPVGTRLRQQRESCAAAKVKISRKARCEPALCEVLSTPLRRKSGERRRTRPGVWWSRPTRVAEPTDACGELTDASGGACGGADGRVCRANQRVWRGVWRSRPTRVPGRPTRTYIQSLLPLPRSSRHCAGCRGHLAWPARARTLGQATRRMRPGSAPGPGRTRRAS
jgi:hypothetical protein